MSFSFQNKFAKSNGDGGGPSDTAAAPAAGSPAKKGKKFNPLLSVKTEDYVDDLELYKPKITRQERYDYYQELLIINKDRKDSTNLVVLSEIQYYPKSFVWAFAFIRSNCWDQWYLNCLLIFFILIVVFSDGWVKLFAPFLITLNANNNLLMIPLALMFVTQIVPLFGTVFFVHFCNDLVRLIASQNFQQWAFVSCLTAQYIEYFYYGGQNRRDKAGKIRRGEVSRFHQLKVRMIEFMERFSKKGAKIEPESSIEGESRESSESGDKDSDDEDEDEDEDESDLSDEDDESADTSKREQKQKEREEGRKKKELEKQKKLEQKEKEKELKQKEKEKEKEKEKAKAEMTIKVTATSTTPAVDDVETGNERKDRPLSPNQRNDRPASAKKALDSNKERPKSASERDKDIETGDNGKDNTNNVSNDEGEEMKEGEEEKVPENPEDYMDWVCIVCKTANHGLKHNPNPQVDIYFGEKGALYRRMYANLVFHSPKPACKKCYTICDYKPPPGSAHVFPHNPEPHVAFTGYPKKHLLIHGLETENNPKNDGKRRILSTAFKNKFYSFFYGKKNDPTSVPMLNDWRLRKYILHHFPKIPKYELKPEEKYEIGEIVECRQQKSEFCRARVLAVHGNDTYDIKYDGGDECRFVLRKEIRLGTEKRPFAYRVEMMAVVIIVSFPLCLIMVLSTSDYGLVFLTMFLLSLGLFVVRLKTFCQYAYNYIDGGVCVIFRFTAFFTLPLFFFFITSVIGVTSGKDPANWGTITALAVMTKLFSLPVLYVLRPVYAVIGSLIFLQTGVGMILLTIYATSPPDKKGALLIPMIPFITTVLTLKYLRKELHNIWDTCFVIRPKIEDKKSNPSIYRSLYDRFDAAWTNFKANYF